MTLDQFQFQNQLHLSQINVVFQSRLKITLHAGFIESGSRIYFFFVVTQNSVNFWDTETSTNCRKRLVRKTGRHGWGDMFVKIFFATDCFVLQNLLERLCHTVYQAPVCLRFPSVFGSLYGCLLIPVTSNQLFFEILPPHPLCRSLEFFSVENNICNFCPSNLPQVSTRKLCNCDNIFRKKWNFSSTNKFHNCMQATSTLSIFSSVERKLHWS